MMMKMRMAVLGLLVLTPSAFAALIAVEGSRSWQQEAAFVNEDTYAFSYTTGDTLLKITQLDVTIGDGVTTTLFTDPTISAPGYLTFGFGSLGGTAAGAATVNDTLVDGDGSGSATFNPGWFLNETFSFNIDTDHDGSGSCGALCIVGRDHVTGTEFNNYGGISFTLYFGVTDPNYFFVGPNTITVPNGNWTTITNGLIPNQNSVSGDWAGTLQVEMVPEPGTYLLMGGGLIGLGIARRRLRR